MDELKGLIAPAEVLAKITDAWFDGDSQRWLGAGDQWLCDQQQDPDDCEEHEKHQRVLWSQTVRGVDYALRWDPTWGQLVVTELGYTVWFRFPATAGVTEADLVQGFQELENAIKDAWRTGN